MSEKGFSLKHFSLPIGFGLFLLGCPAALPDGLRPGQRLHNLFPRLHPERPNELIVPEYNYYEGKRFGEAAHDVLSHSRKGRVYEDTNIDTKIHETIHHLDNDLSETRVNGRKDDNQMAFYLGQGRGIRFLINRRVRKSHFLPLVPKSLRGEMWRMYLLPEKVVSEMRPEAALDELNAYMYSAEVAVQSRKKGAYPGNRVEPISWALEYAYFGLSYAQALQKYDPQYLEKTPEIKQLLRENIERIYGAYKEGLNDPQFASSLKKYAMPDKFARNPDAADLRAFTRQFFGAEWAKQTMGI